MYSLYSLVFLLVAAGLPLASAQNLSNGSLLDDDLELLNSTVSDIEDLVDEDLADDVEGNETDVAASMPSHIVINEVELNPRGSDVGREWIELYNPTGSEVNASDFMLKTSFKASNISLPRISIDSGETYVLELDRQTLSNTAEIVSIIDNDTGRTVDRTPSLVDRSDDGRTWQRMPDGGNEWQFAASTKDRLNDPDSASTRALKQNEPRDSSDIECTGSAGCAEGIVVRIVDGDTLYIRVNNTLYKVDLALAEAPSKSEDGFAESTAFTRGLCLGSSALIDQDDEQLASRGTIIATVYCSTDNLNSELLDEGHATLDEAQCAKSEFASEPWAEEHGC
jgi:endonuclease YncB( thermonuclease family)